MLILRQVKSCYFGEVTLIALLTCHSDFDVKSSAF